MLDKKAVGKRINAYRKAKKISSEHLSELIGKSSGAYIRSIENGKTGLSMKTLVDICNALQVSPEVILADCLEFDIGYQEKSPLFEVAQSLNDRDSNLLYNIALVMRDEE